MFPVRLYFLAFVNSPTATYVLFKNPTSPHINIWIFQSMLIRHIWKALSSNVFPGSVNLVEQWTTDTTLMLQPHWIPLSHCDRHTLPHEQQGLFAWGEFEECTSLVHGERARWHQPDTGLLSGTQWFQSHTQADSILAKTHQDLFYPLSPIKKQFRPETVLGLPISDSPIKI